MYLKSLEMVGFKSFAESTKLEFQPGMTAVVGPNGCGKSNIADAVRWVLGEQSAKAMRASKMEDCIFNGTDLRKPLGMAEVSITFADCEKGLGIEFNEVTITRRVFRSGEGQYFLNKTACRLKDIQRLFLGTGIGTTSYSLMEQGQIDRVLSSHPEDRRTIFEEASGITKFKADKKEAIRKLEYTEANLLRLADVIREVKRQIGSLQRQAGKARRYKELREEMRKYDVYASQYKLTGMSAEIDRLKAEIASLTSQMQTAKTEIEEMEQGNSVLRKSVLQTEHEIGALLGKGMEASSKLEHTQEMIAVNRKQIEEYLSLAKRDTAEVERARSQIEEQRRTATELADRIQRSAQDHAKAQSEMKASNDTLAAHQQEIDSARRNIQNLRSEFVELESRVSKLQNQLAQMDAQEHSDAVRRERLFAEQTQLEAVVKRYARRQEDMHSALEAAKKDVVSCTATFKDITQRQVANHDAISKTRQILAELRSEASAREAEIAMMNRLFAGPDAMPAGAKHILGETNPAQVPRDSVYGVLSTQLTVDPEYHCAAEAALRFCLNAILVRDTSTAMRMLRHLSTQRPGPARIFAVDSLPNTVPADVSIPGSVRLLDHVRASDNIIGFIRKLLANVIVVPNLDSIPEPLPSELVLVTRNGAMIRGDGYAEFWFPSSIPDSTASSEKTLKDIEHQLESARTEISAAESSLQKLTAEEKMLLDSLRTVQNALDQQRHTFAVREGEYQIVSTESNQARDRLDTVTWEINNLTTSEKSIPSQRASITAEIDTARSQREKVFTSIESATKSLAVLENRQAELQADVTKQSMKFAQINQVVEHLQSNQASALKRLAELENLIQSRSDGIVSYENQVKHLKESISEAENRIVSLKNAVETNTAKADGMKKNMEKQVKELEKLESVLDQKSSALETLRATGSNLTVKLTETTMRRQNHIDRITSDYSMTEAQLMEQPEPQWQAEKPSIDALETMIAELRTKLEAMGPVNLVAIEEYQELEERYTFLTQQEQDLVNSKQQLVELIKKINRTTSEMFSSTFAAVNENFQAMFKRLFNGGSAKLVLVNEEDVLECGIEIIARPPGKRLQNISLLSGGEKTLTAVALLFAIYMIRPSPFCLLDELDAPLDESNIGRFVNVLQEFLRQSQFVVITHNRQTIAAAGVLYGITMPEKGVSKIVSMKFTDQKTRTFGAPTPVEPVTTS